MLDPPADIVPGRGDKLLFAARLKPDLVDLLLQALVLLFPRLDLGLERRDGFLVSVLGLLVRLRFLEQLVLLLDELLGLLQLDLHLFVFLLELDELEPEWLVATN